MSLFITYFIANDELISSVAFYLIKKSDLSGVFESNFSLF